MESPQPAARPARLEILIPPKSMALVRQAAEIEGQSINDFATFTVCDAAAKAVAGMQVALDRAKPRRGRPPAWNAAARQSGPLAARKVSLSSTLPESQPEGDALQAQETRWLVRNRHLYAGQWIALEGDTLLATGKTGAEVYDKVGQRATPPLVMLIENSDRPFAGW